MDSFRRGRIEAAQQPVERAGTLRLAFGQPGAQFLVAGRAGKETVDEGAQIKSCAAGHHGQAVPRRDFHQKAAAQAGIFAGCEDLVWVDNIQCMVRNPMPGRFRQLGRADVEMAIDLQRITVDDFTVEFLRDTDGKLAFAGPGGAYHCNQGKEQIFLRLSVSVGQVTVIQ